MSGSDAPTPSRANDLLLSYLNPQSASSTARRTRHWRIILGWILLLALAHMLDHWAFQETFVPDPAARSVVESKDWYRLLRVMGYLPAWLAVGGVMLLAARPDRSASTWAAGTGRRESTSTIAVLIPVIAGLAGLFAEALKVVVRRGRPVDFNGAYGWVGTADGFFHTSEMGMASSHAAVAFGAAFAVMKLQRRAGWVLLPLAAGCGLTRMLSGQHFLSDTVGGAALGWLAAWVLSSPDARRRLRRTQAGARD